MKTVPGEMPQGRGALCGTAARSCSVAAGTLGRHEPLYFTTTQPPKLKQLHLSYCCRRI